MSHGDSSRVLPYSSSEEAAASGEPASSIDRRLETGLVLVWLIPLGVLASIALFHSLSWRMQLDTPLAHYSAFMHAEYGARPYADVFEISFPGTVLVHLGITKLVGYGDFGFMAVNFVWFLALCGVTWSFLEPFGRLIRVAVLVMFGSTYFGYGQEMPLQRDCILILPVVLALWLLTAAKLEPRLRRVAIGTLLGIAATIKPHAAIAFLPVLNYDLRQLPPSGRSAVLRLARVGLSYGAGFVVPFLFMFAWLGANGGFGAWLEMSREYLPLYLSLSDRHTVIPEGTRFWYLFQNDNAFGANFEWCFATGVGMLVAFTRTATGTRKREVVLLVALEALAFAIYPSLSGQYWDYHFVPLVFFMCVLCSFCLLPAAESAPTAERLFPKLALIFSLVTACHFAEETLGWLKGEPCPAPGDGMVDDAASYLKARLQPGDTVQPLDWTDGAAHAMLIARARLATRFMYDYHFYHHVSKPFVHELRRRFLSEFEAAKPRFVLDWHIRKLPSGDDTTTEFPQFRELLARDYQIVRSNDTYRVYERLPLAEHARVAR
jgi:hypothetical protein